MPSHSGRQFHYGGELRYDNICSPKTLRSLQILQITNQCICKSPRRCGIPDRNTSCYSFFSALFQMSLPTLPISKICTKIMDKMEWGLYMCGWPLANHLRGFFSPLLPLTTSGPLLRFPRVLDTISKCFTLNISRRTYNDGALATALNMSVISLMTFFH